ncbi:transposable element Tc1 transposase [Trichonephila clavipes]|nr:transposable element Tc1 transposase [Trichonephila clavipes]
MFSAESCFQLCPDDHRRRVWRRPGQRADPAFHIARHTSPQQGVMKPGLIFKQDNAKPRPTRVAMNCLTAYRTLSWPARSPNPSPIEHVLDMMGRRLHLTGNFDDLARQLEKICQEITRETTRVLYHSIARRVTACIQARGGSTPY